MNARAYNAPIEAKGPKPAYVVRASTEDRTRTVCQFDEKSKTITRREVVVPAGEGFYVEFLRGHVNFYHSLEALEDAGFGEVVELIRSDSDSEMNSEHDSEKTLIRQPIVKGK